MRFDHTLYLKWIEREKFSLLPTEFKFINQCLITEVDTERNILGFSVFEPRNLDDKFCLRLKNRIEQSQISSQFVLYLPLFLKHKVEALFQVHGFSNVRLVYTSFLKIKCLGGVLSVQSKIKVMNVDDSPVLLQFLKKGLEADESIEVVSQVSDSRKAIEAINRILPDVITMDIQMPGKTGVDLLNDMQKQERRFPVIMVSSLGDEDGSFVFDALNLGAFDYIQKPNLKDKDQFQSELSEKILHAAAGSSTLSMSFDTKVAKAQFANSNSKAITYSSDLLWCIGASTGGTQALTQILTSLPREVPPVLVVQHIPPVYSQAFAESLSRLCPFVVKEAKDGELVKPNHVYIAAGGLQMRVEKYSRGLILHLRDDEPVNRFKPSVDYLFNHLSQLRGYKIVAALLTGMGRDGAEGLLKLRQSGARTMAQDEATSAVYGMPRAAVEIGAAELQVPLSDVANAFLRISHNFGPDRSQVA